MSLVDDEYVPLEDRFISGNTVEASTKGVKELSVKFRLSLMFAGSRRERELSMC